MLQEADDPPSSGQISGKLTPRHNAYIIHLTSIHHEVHLSSHIITRRVNMVQQNYF